MHEAQSFVALSPGAQSTSLVQDRSRRRRFSSQAQGGSVQTSKYNFRSQVYASFSDMSLYKQIQIDILKFNAIRKVNGERNGTVISSRSQKEVVPSRTCRRISPYLKPPASALVVCKNSDFGYVLHCLGGRGVLLCTRGSVSSGLDPGQEVTPSLLAPSVSSLRPNWPTSRSACLARGLVLLAMSWSPVLSALTGRALRSQLWPPDSLL